MPCLKAVGSLLPGLPMIVTMGLVIEMYRNGDLLAENVLRVLSEK